MYQAWQKEDSLPKYVQLELFPLTSEEILHYRLIQAEEKIKDLLRKQDSQRKAQFGKIGTLEKKYSDLSERLAIIERGICKTDLHEKECEIVELTI